MAEPWSKFRHSLFTAPRVHALASLLSKAPATAMYVFQTAARDLLGVTPTVTQDVMRDVTVAGLLRVWAEANRHTSNGVFHPADLSLLDSLSKIPGFGVAMAEVGYAVFDAESRTVTLPNFEEHNVPAKGKGLSANAERQRRFREKKKAKAAQNETKEPVTGNAGNNALPSISSSISVTGSNTVTALEKLKKRINGLSPSWTKAAHWGHEEERQMIEALPNLSALDEQDWHVLGWFCRQAFHPSNGMTAKDEIKCTSKRGQFVADLAGILARATQLWKQHGAPGPAKNKAASSAQATAPVDVVPPTEAGLLFRGLCADPKTNP